MGGPFVGFIVWAVMMSVLIAVIFKRKRRLRGRIGPAAAGSVYELLNEDKRKAIEIIVEERTGKEIQKTLTVICRS